MTDTVTINMLQASDIQKIFGMGKTDAYALMHSAGFPTIKINKRLYVSEDALKQWVQTYTGQTFFIN